MDIVVACTRNAVVMVEGKADELSEDEVLAGIFHAFEHLQPLIDLQEQLQKSSGKTKRTVAALTVDEDLRAKVQLLLQPGWKRYLIRPINLSGAVFMTSLKLEVVAALDPEKATRQRDWRTALCL